MAAGLTRVRNWDLALLDFATEEAGKPFVWGETDCASLCRRGHEHVYGSDPWPDLPSWTTRTGALRALAKVGGLVAFLEDECEEHPQTFLQQADLIYTPQPESDFGRLGLFVGGGMLSSHEDRGVYFVSGRHIPEQARVFRRG